MTKILGYTNGEISRLYIWSTTIVVIICLLLSLPIEKAVMNVLFREMMLTSISGWIALWIDPKIYVEMFLIGIGTYAVVAMPEVYTPHENGLYKVTVTDKGAVSVATPVTKGDITSLGIPAQDTTYAPASGKRMA